MSLLSRASDTFYAFRFLYLLTQPWEKTEAFKLGLVDAGGKVLKSAETPEERSAYTIFHRLAFNVKRLLGMFPGGRTRIASYAAALYLLKEHCGATDEDVDRIASTISGSGLLNEGEDHSWVPFAPEDCSLGVPRKRMPQVKSEHRGALVNFLSGRGISTIEKSVKPGALSPTQSEYSPAKVDAARRHTGGDRALLVSRDNRVVDGHHQWLAALKDRPEEKIRVILIDMTARDLVGVIHEFPSSTVEESRYVDPAGRLIAGRYRAASAVCEASGDAIRDASVVAESSEPVGTVLDSRVYRVRHADGGTAMLVVDTELRK